MILKMETSQSQKYFKAKSSYSVNAQPHCYLTKVKWSTKLKIEIKKTHFAMKYIS